MGCWGAEDSPEFSRIPPNFAGGFPDCASAKSGGMFPPRSGPHVVVRGETRGETYMSHNRKLEQATPASQIDAPAAGAPAARVDMEREVGLEFVRATEAGALSAYKWM